MRPVDFPTLPLKIWSQFFFEKDGAALGVVYRYRERLVLVHVEELQVCELACGKSFLPLMRHGCGPSLTPSTWLFSFRDRCFQVATKDMSIVVRMSRYRLYSPGKR